MLCIYHVEIFSRRNLYLYNINCLIYQTYKYVNNNIIQIVFCLIFNSTCGKFLDKNIHLLAEET